MSDRRIIKPELDLARHTYTLGGRPLAAVTTIIHVGCPRPELEEYFARTPAATIVRDREEAREFGISVHAALSAHLAGANLIPLPREERWHATVKAGIAWLYENVEDVLAIEEPIAEPRRGYAGKPDIYAILRGARRMRGGPYAGRLVPTIIDFKTTREVYWSHLCQLAAYREAAYETYDDPKADRLVLRFDKEEPGKIQAFPCRHHDRDFQKFEHARGNYQIQLGGMQ